MPMQTETATANAQTSFDPEQREPFLLADGNTNVEHAGMAVNVDRIRNLSGAL